MAGTAASTKRRWSTDEVEELTRLATSGASAPELASILVRSTGAVQQKALELGIVLVRVEKTAWWQGWPARPPRHTKRVSESSSR
jgi:hypothetical protein